MSYEQSTWWNSLFEDPKACLEAFSQRASFCNLQPIRTPAERNIVQEGQSELAIALTKETDQRGVVSGAKKTNNKKNKAAEKGKGTTKGKSCTGQMVVYLVKSRPCIGLVINRNGTKVTLAENDGKSRKYIKSNKMRTVDDEDIMITFVAKDETIPHYVLSFVKAYKLATTGTNKN